MGNKVIGSEGAYETQGGGYANGIYNAETKKFVGTKAKIEAEAKKYKYGEEYVSGITVNYLENGMAELIVSYSKSEQVQTQEDETGEPPSNFECSFVQDSLPLALHPLFPENQLKVWRKFLSSPEHIQASKKYLVDPNDLNSKQEAIPDEIIKAVDLFNKGITTFVTYNPIVTQIQVYTKEPQSLKTVGMREKPPKWSDLAKDWLKTADSISFDGNARTWTRNRQWTGAYEWPKALYDASPVSGK